MSEHARHERGPAATVPSQLMCPRCRGDVRLNGSAIVCDRCGDVGERRQGVWDFVVTDTYAESFGAQWARHQGTQLDSRNGTSISHDRFRSVTGWSPDTLRGRRVLDAGSGAGRFSEVAIEFGAELTALDLSTAAYATRDALSGGGAVVVRGDLLRPPLRPATFDKVFSIGVLQHTPDPLGAAASLLQLVGPGGEVVIWMYERRWYTEFLPKMLLRRVTCHLSPPAVTRLAGALVALFTPVARMSSRLPTRAGRVVRALLPIASYWGDLPLSPAQQREWSLLDTHDWLSPRFDLPTTFPDLERALLDAGASQVTRLPAPGLTVRAVRGEDVS